MTFRSRTWAAVAVSAAALMLVAAGSAAAAPANPYDISHHTAAGNGPFNVNTNCSPIASVQDGAFRACIWHQGDHVRSGYIYGVPASLGGGEATIKYYDAWSLAANPFGESGHYITWAGSFAGGPGSRTAVWTDYRGPSVGYAMHTTVLFEGGRATSPSLSGY